MTPTQALQTAHQTLSRLHAQRFELYLESRSALKIDSKEQKVENLSRAQDAGLSIRVVSKGRMGFSFTTSLQKVAIERACQSAVDVAAQMPEDPHAVLPELAGKRYAAMNQFDSQGLALPIDQKIARAKELEALCLKTDSRVKAVRSASLRESLVEAHLMDTSGTHLSHQASVFTASLSCKAEEGGDSQMGGDFGYSYTLGGLDLPAIAREAARTATELLGAGAAPTGKRPAILRNSVVAELLDLIAGSFSAEAIYKGRSMLASRFGERAFAECITLEDDGLLAGGLATSPFDGEGTPSQTHRLIDGGLVTAPLYDLYYASKMKAQPTGNASRGIKAPPSISSTNLVLKPGKRGFSQLVSELSQGILITDLMGLHTANEVTGDFSLGASGILIEDGKLTRPVKGFAVAGNVLELFRRAEEVASDTRSFGTVWAPSLRVAELSIGGS